MREKFFDSGLIEFLEDLANNNNREWFNKNKNRYERQVIEPALAFISAIRPALMEISPFLKVEAKKVGGSLFRIYRDIRFSKDKTPYKTHVGIRFPHSDAKEKTGPGLYMHIDPRHVYLAGGVWHPESAALRKIRAGIDKDQDGWLKVRDEKKFRNLYNLSGDSLKNPPRGYTKDHPFLEDLKRKDFVCVKKLSPQALFRPTLVSETAGSYRVAKPFLSFLAKALEVPF
jgi:uncharacterized protein (TIGR02453 family)